MQRSTLEEAAKVLEEYEERSIEEASILCFSV